MADRVVLNRTNRELLQPIQERNGKHNTGITYDGQGACVLTLKDEKEDIQLKTRGKIKRLKNWRKSGNKTIDNFFKYQKPLCDQDLT